MVEEPFESDSFNRNISLSISIIIHAILVFLILFLPSLKYDFPPPGKEGILVMFGDTKESTGEEQEKIEEKTVEANNKAKEIQKKQKKDKKAEIEKTIKEKDNPVIAESEKDIKDVKEEFSKLFKSRGSKKKSNGIQGDPLGSKDAEILEGITRGKGKIGEGLDSRGILEEPLFDDSSQKSGTVVVKVCVDKLGNVISSRYTQRGSTTTDSELIELAVNNSKEYRFSRSNIDKQCGTITVEFIVR